MSSWLTEQDFRDLQDDPANWPGLTLNVAFLNDIKQDSENPEKVLGEIRTALSRPAEVKPSQLVSMLGQLRDELETYFALEEFYGYFRSAREVHSRVSNRAEDLRTQHEQIFLDLCELIELAESALYREATLETALPAITAGFLSFVQSFQNHEQEEQELMMQLCNDDIGVGD